MHFHFIFIAILQQQHPATHSTFPWQILLEKAVRLKHDIFCNARDNKAEIKTIPSILIYQVQAQNQLRIKCIQGKITKPTQNQVYSSQNQHHIPETKKTADIKNNTPAADDWQNNNKHSFKICNK